MRLKASAQSAMLAVYCSGLMCGAFVGKVPPALPLIRADLDLTLLETSFIATMMNVLGALMGIATGALSDRYGHKRLALTGLALLFAGGLFGALAPHYAALLLSRFMEGMGFIIVTVSGVALMAATQNAVIRQRGLALWSTYMPAGACAALVLAPLLTPLIGWRGLWWLHAIFAGLVFVALWATVHTTPGTVQRSWWRFTRESLSQPASIALSVAFLFYTAQWAAVMVWLPTFAVEHGASASLAAWFTAGMVGINVPGNLIGAQFLQRGWSRGTLVMLGSIGQGAAAAFIFLDLVPDAGRYVACLAFSLIGGFVPCAILSGVPQHARSAAHVGTTNGMIMQASQLGQFFAPILIAWLVTHFGTWSAGFAAMLALACAAATAGTVLHHFEQRAKSAITSS